jgi:hypothetical protein
VAGRPLRCFTPWTGSCSSSSTAAAAADAAPDERADAAADQAPACYPLFHACTTTDQCCAPNRCLNITGTPACQQEGPRVDGG